MASASPSPTDSDSGRRRSRSEPPAIPDNLVARLSEMLAAQTGLHFPEKRWADLRRGIASAAVELEIEDPVLFAKQLAAAGRLTKRQIDLFADHLTVGETYFFRDANVFAALETKVLPELIRARRGKDQRLRIWSAGCCSGEEPYSLAILLHRLVHDIEDWDITILGTDINARFLRKATEGIYGDRSFRTGPDWLRRRCFTKADGERYAIRERYGKMVKFGQLNLVEDVYPSLLTCTNGMDLILCRNVLMYLASHQVEKAAANFFRALNDGGWLVVAPSETSRTVFRQFETVHFPGAVFYRKDEARTNSGTHAAPERDIALPAKRPPTPPLPAAAEPVPERKPENPLLLARSLANEGRFDEALRACETAIAADKLDPSRRYLRAMILQEKGATDEAILSLKRALFLDSRFVMAHYALAALARQQGNSEEAEKQFRNAAWLAGQLPREEILEESEGITAGRLVAMIARNIEPEPPDTA